MDLAILSLIFIAVFISALFIYRTKKQNIELKKQLEWHNILGSKTKPISEVTDEGGMDIPEEDQEYLEPIIVEFLRQLVFTKVNTPTNAMLIDQLSDAIGMALEEYEPRRGKDEYQRGNKGWMLVAAYATRLYVEGTPHDSTTTRDQMAMTASFSKTHLEKWAKHVSDQIASKLKQDIQGDTPGVKDVTEKALMTADGKFTLDELEDMRKGLIKGQFNEGK